MSDTAQHFAGKYLFCKLDCSQAYLCLQTVVRRSAEMHVFNFAGGTFENRRNDQGLSRSLSAFSSLMREYLDPAVKADQYAQYVDDIGIAVKNATDLFRNIRAFFKCVRKAGLKLTIKILKSDCSKSLAEPFNQKESHHNLKKTKTSLANSVSPSQKKLRIHIWVSKTITEIIYPRWLKNSTHSTNFQTQKCKLTSHQD